MRTLFNDESAEKMAKENFLNEIMPYLQRNYSYICQYTPNHELREYLYSLVEQAEEIGFTQRGPVRFFVDMTIVLGSNFITDPSYYWISQFLEEHQSLDQLEMSMLLHKKVNHYLNQVMSDEYQRWKQIKENLLFLINQNKQEPEYTFYITGFEEYILRKLALIYPEKYHLLSEEALAHFVLQAREKAQQNYSFRGSKEELFVIVLMFIFGHEFDQTPLLAWAKTHREKSNEYGYIAGIEDKTLNWISILMEHYSTQRE